MSRLQQVPHRFLIDIGEYLSVYLDEERIRKFAEGFRGCKGTCLTFLSDAGGSTDLA